jgi:hypothetical protein
MLFLYCGLFLYGFTDLASAPIIRIYSVWIERSMGIHNFVLIRFKKPPQWLAGNSVFIGLLGW